MTLTSLILYLHLNLIRYLTQHIPRIVSIFEHNTPLQNIVMFATLFCFTESIVLILTFIVLLRKSSILKSELRKITSSFNVQPTDSLILIQQKITQSKTHFSKTSENIINSIIQSRSFRSRYKFNTSSIWITTLNVIVLFLLLLNAQFILSFKTILWIFYFSLLAFALFLFANLFTIRWLTNPKGNKSFNVYRIHQKENMLFEKAKQHQISLYIKSKYPTIESFLEIDRWANPQFFRFNGPKWIDFQKGFIVKDSTLKKILKLLETKRISIKMDSAKGKTTFASYLGFELSKKGKICVYLTFKRNKPTLKEINDLVYLLNESNGYLLIDDLHLVASEDLLLNSDVKDKPNKVVFISQKTIPSYLARNTYQTQPNLNLRIIERFVSIVKKEPNHAKPIKDIALKRSTIETYRNLFILCLELFSINENESIQNILFEMIENIHVENVLLPVAILYQNEIPIRKEYLIKYLLINEKEIDTACQSSMFYTFQKKSGISYIGLCHSSLAKIVVSFYRELTSFGETIKRNILYSFSPQETHSFYNSSKFIFYYLKKYPQEGTTILSRIGTDLCNNLCKFDGFSELLISILKKSTYINTHIAYNIGNSQIKNVFSSLPVPIIESVIDNMKNNCDLQSFINLFQYYEKFQSIPVSVFSSLISASNSLVEVSSLLLLLSKFEYKNLDQISPSLFASKIQSSDNVAEIGQLMKTLKNTLSNEFFEIIITLLPVSVFIDHIQSTNDLEYICILIKDLQTIRYPHINDLHPQLFVEKILKTKDLEKISWFLSNLQLTVSPTIFSETIRLIPASDIANKIEQCENLRSIGLMLSYLDEIHYLYITKLPPSLFDNKIRMGTDLRDISMLLSTLQETCTKSVFKTILKSLNVIVFIEKIKESSNLQDVSILLSTLQKIQYSELDKIPTSLYIYKLNQNESIQEIEILLNILKQVLTDELFRSVIASLKMDLLVSKIRLCDDLGDVSSFLQALYRSKYRDMHRLPVDVFVKKIQQSDDCVDIEKLLVALTKIQFTHSRELLELIDPDMFYEKLFVSSNKEDKLSFLSQLQLMEYPYINQLENQLSGATDET